MILPENPAIITSIDRRPNLAKKEFIEKYLNRGIPVVIPGAMKEWKAFSTWEPSHFRELLGNKTIFIDGRKSSMQAFMDTVIASSENKPSAYLNEVNINKEFPELLRDISPVLSYSLPDRLRSHLIPEKWGFRHGVLELLIGGKGTKFPTLHYDGYYMNTFITQIRGDKEFIFYAPDQTPYMYPEEKMYNRSRINDVYDPDLEQFPLFAKATPVTITVGQGDTVFLPAGWWHTTRLLSLSIAVSTNTIAPGQWARFVNDFVPGMSTSKLKRSVYKTYLKGAGILMSMSGK